MRSRDFDKRTGLAFIVAFGIVSLFADSASRAETVTTSQLTRVRADLAHVLGVNDDRRRLYG
jgi:hypothetical protein